MKKELINGERYDDMRSNQIINWCSHTKVGLRVGLSVGLRVGFFHI